jgi:hypothetical protein
MGAHDQPPTSPTLDRTNLKRARVHFEMAAVDICTQILRGHSSRPQLHVVPGPGHCPAGVNSARFAQTARARADAQNHVAG